MTGGEHVHWESGVLDGKPESAVGKHTHCSAFAASRNRLFRASRSTVAGVVPNVTNFHYYTFAQQTGASGAEYANVEPPAMYGVRLRYSFGPHAKE